MLDGPTEKLTDRYNREAHAYRELWAPVLRSAGRSLLQELAHTPVQRILDVGTGVGTLLPDLRAAFPDAFVLGVDRAHGMIALAPEEFPRAVMDARQPLVNGPAINIAYVAGPAGVKIEIVERPGLKPGE